MAPSCAGNLYENCPLCLGSREVRLVKVLPGSSSPIRCEFTSVVLDQCPPYSALSYTWGSSDSSGKILLGQFETTVGSNLVTFLHRLSRNGNTSFFWIDALCINQADMLERSHQVGLMKDIYSNAHRVIIWLGEASSEGYTAMRVIKEAYRDAPKNHEGCSASQRLAIRGKEELAYLYEHEYWSRVWIVQEVMYAKKLVIYWGKGTLLWEWLAYVSDFPTKDRLYSSPAAMIIRAKAAWRGPVPLSGLLAGCLHLCSSDIRDKVFGLLGLASQPGGESSLGLQADYSMTPEQVFQAACSLVCRSNFFNHFDEMLVFSRNLRNSFGVPVPEKRLLDLVRESGMKGREGPHMRGLKHQTKERDSRCPSSTSMILSFCIF